MKTTTAEWLNASRDLSKEQDAAHNKRLVTQVVCRHHYNATPPVSPKSYVPWLQYTQGPPPVEPLVIREFATLGIARDFARELMRRHDSIDRVELLKPDLRKEVIYRADVEAGG